MSSWPGSLMSNRLAGTRAESGSPHLRAVKIVAVDLNGNSEVTGHGPAGLGWANDWLPDGGLLVTGQELLRREPDGSMVRHADLSRLADFWNEIVVDGRGNIYLNSIRFGFLAGQPPTSGIIELLAPYSTVQPVVGTSTFTPGMVNIRVNHLM